jgi:hypothetical protein
MEKIEDYWRSHSYTPNNLDLDRAKASMRGRKVWDSEAEKEITVKGVRLLLRVKLLEVSAVVVPANNLAAVMVVKSASRPATKESAKAEKESKGVNPVAGKTFLDRSREMVAVIGEYGTRAENRVDFRIDRGRKKSLPDAENKAGRVISRETEVVLTSVADAAEDLGRRIRDLLARANAKPADELAASDDAAKSAPPEPATPAVTPPAPAEPSPAIAPSAPDAPPALDEADILATYHATQYALTMATVGSLTHHG